MTDEDWHAIEFMEVRGLANLRIDGHRVTITLTRHKMKLYYRVYVDGLIDFGMSDELKKKFWFECKTRLWKKDDFKGIPKRYLKKANINPDAKSSHFSPRFGSFSSLKKVLSMNTEIEVVGEEF